MALLVVSRVEVIGDPQSFEPGLLGHRRLAYQSSGVHLLADRK